MRYVFVIMLCLLPAIAHATGGGLGSQQPANPPAAQKPPKANTAKLKQLAADLKALKQKMSAIKGLEAQKQQRLDQMHDHLAKMQALLNSIIEE